LPRRRLGEGGREVGSGLRRHAPCLPRRSVCAKTGRALFLSLFVITPSASFPNCPPFPSASGDCRTPPGHGRASPSPPLGGLDLRSVPRSRFRLPAAQNPNPGARGEEERHCGGQRLRRCSRRQVPAYGLHDQTPPSRHRADRYADRADIRLVPSSNAWNSCFACLPILGRFSRLPSEPWTAFDKDRPSIGRLLKFSSLTPQDSARKTRRALPPRARNPSGYLRRIRKHAGLLFGATGAEKTPATFRVPFLCDVRSRQKRHSESVAPRAAFKERVALRRHPGSRAVAAECATPTPSLIRLRRTGGTPSLRSPVRCSLRSPVYRVGPRRAFFYLRRRAGPRSPRKLLCAGVAASRLRGRTLRALTIQPTTRAIYPKTDQTPTHQATAFTPRASVAPTSADSGCHARCYALRSPDGTTFGLVTVTFRPEARKEVGASVRKVLFRFNNLAIARQSAIFCCICTEEQTP